MSHSRMTWKRVWAAVLSVCMALSLALPASAAEAQTPVYADGTYQGTAAGFGGDVTLSVTIVGGKITAVEEVSQSETAEYWNKAKVLMTTIVEQQTADVDGISGATYSSNGIKNAVKNALNQAALDPNGPFTQGNGTEGNPYIIPNGEKLAIFAQKVDEGETYEGKFIALGGDIALSGQWNPIGGEETKAANIFQGALDGNGYTISGLTLNAEYTAEQNVGLFSTLGKQAVVKNLNLTGVDIRVKTSDVIRAGAVAGDTETMSSGNGTTLDAISAQGSVDVSTTGNALAFAGGLLGRSMKGAVMVNNWTDVAVSSLSTGGNNSAYSGGIVGSTGLNNLIANNATFGSVYAGSPASTNYGGMAGGITAMVAGKMWNNVSMGNVTISSNSTEHSWVGALIGQGTISGMVKDGDGKYQYPETGALRAFAYYPEDLVLTAERGGTAATLPVTASGFTTSSTPYDTAVVGTAMARSAMASADFIDALDDNLADVNQLMKAYEISGVTLRQWVVADGRAIPTGNVWDGKGPSDPVFDSGKGTKKNPYVIKTADQLRAFAASVSDDLDYNRQYIQLAADVNISGSDWTPIGGGAAAFNGSFDGMGYTIKGLTMGSESAPVALESSTRAGFFGLLGKNAVVKNVKLTDVYTNVSSAKGVQLGGLAGAISDGTLIDSCSVSGTVQASCTKGNVFQGGVVGRMDGGVLINSSSNTLVVSENTAAYPEAGGLTGMNNGGLVANCYTLGDVVGKTGEDNSGYTLTGLLVGYLGSDMVNCYANGSLSTNDKSQFSGMLAGWLRGYARAYNCWYNGEATMTMNGQAVTPIKEVGVAPTPYPDDDGKYYIGGLTDGLASYTASSKASVANSLNQTLTAFPVNLSDYGVDAGALKSWTYDSATQTVILSDSYATTTYTRPQCEVIPQEEQIMQDGVWYGRDKDKKSVVAVTVADNKVTKTEVVNGESSGDAYDAAVQKAEEKALYGDPSTYEAVDPGKFAGGTGTQEDPYLISNEEQLRYIAEAINEDVDWKDCYFKQTADITLTKGDWVPIGWAVMAKVKARETVYAQYPFRGNYDGGDFRITGLTIGSKDKPSADPRCALTAGLFGVLEGEETVGFTPTADARYVNLRNIHLTDVSINVETRFDSYVGAVAADPETGFHMINCSASGEINTKANGSVYAGGLAGYPLMGLIQGSWADVNVNAETVKGAVYAGGLCGMDIRVTTVNSFALGDVNCNSESGEINAGGLSGDFAGIRYNSYAAGNVTSGKDTEYIGLVNGYLSGIAGDTNVFYNSDAKLTVAGKELTEKPVNGYSAGAASQSVTVAKTAAELAGENFAKLLNENNTKAVNELNAMYEIVKEINHHGHAMYYPGDGSDLPQWAVVNSVVAFQNAAVNPREPVAKDLSGAAVSGLSAKTYTGKAQKPAVTVTLDGVTLAKGTDYTVSYQNNTNAGTATVTIKGKGDYTGTVQKTFKINKAAISKAKFASIAAKTYTGKALKPGVKVTFGGSTLKAKTAYTLTYSANKNVGTATVTVKGKGNFSGSKKLTFKINPKGTVLSKVTAGKKAFTAKWKKQATQTTGYQVQYSTNAKFKSGNKTVTVKKNKTTSTAVKKLKAKKKYYVRIRTYKTVKGKQFVSAWSKAKTVTTKK